LKELRVITTDDGSHSLYVPHLDETYHSSFGAITESEHIFIESGLHHFCHSNPQASQVSIFELGFGTGLNALLSYRYALQTHIEVKYISIESDPLPLDFAMTLNYPALIDFKGSGDIFRALHESSWDQTIQLVEFFSIKKIHRPVEHFEGQQDMVEVIYFDAFAPGIQPAIWSREILQMMFDMIKVGGVLVTYCVQGQFRRDLKAVGFHVEKLPGPPGKREIVRAVKTE